MSLFGGGSRLSKPRTAIFWYGRSILGHGGDLGTPPPGSGSWGNPCGYQMPESISVIPTTMDAGTNSVPLARQATVVVAMAACLIKADGCALVRGSSAATGGGPWGTYRITSASLGLTSSQTSPSSYYSPPHVPLVHQSSSHSASLARGKLAACRAC